MIGVAILGSTGSIGRSTLEVLRRQREHFRVVALTCGRNHAEFATQVEEWRPAFAGLAVASTLVAPLGARLAHHLSPRKLQLAFSGMLVLVAFEMLRG